ncbi:MAG: DNA-protecting protein DprA [Bacteroidetes bacterium]|nr:DNA-protecting protein DprA [Bacteroidota bacterium]
MKVPLFYQLALSMIPNIGGHLVRQLLQHFGEVSNILNQPVSKLTRVPGIGELRAKAIAEFDDFNRVEREMEFIYKNNIETSFCLDEDFPKRLSAIQDQPLIIFRKGEHNLDDFKMIAIVGTRKNSEHGKELCENFIRDLSPLDCTIVSGMAYGIDVIAHKAALENNLKTVGVMAHGLDVVYPSVHRNLARQMMETGALVTEFPTKTKPDRENFPKRNRIVAGLIDALIVIESPAKGGSMITANLAFNYDREVAAFPGNVEDELHRGCHQLIKQQKAHLIESAEDLVRLMGWEPLNGNAVQKTLLLDLSESELSIVNLLKEHHTLSIDSLFNLTNLSQGELAQVLIGLEFKDLLRNLPGKNYQLK